MLKKLPFHLYAEETASLNSRQTGKWTYRKVQWKFSTKATLVTKLGLYVWRGWLLLRLLSIVVIFLHSTKMVVVETHS